MPKPETIAWLKQSAAMDGSATAQTLLEVLERLERLEAARPTSEPVDKAELLVMTVAEAIDRAYLHGRSDWFTEAHVVIRTVANWLEPIGFVGAADALRGEAERHG